MGAQGVEYSFPCASRVVEQEDCILIGYTFGVTEVRRVHVIGGESMPDTAQFFDTMARERAQLLKAIMDVPEAVLDRKGTVGEWSIKNVLAHLTAWESVVASFLPQRFATGNKSEKLKAINADEDGWNAGEVAAREVLSPREQVEELEQARQNLLRVLRDLGEEGLQRKRPWPECREDQTVMDYILEQVGEHEREHREAILAAIARLQTEKPPT
jgi:uncharacterized damage-inducible protein DinB